MRVFWSDLANPEQCLGTQEALKQAALQYHQVLREVLARVTPLPFRFPTLLEDEPALRAHVSQEQESYRNALDRIGDTLQYEVIASWTTDEHADLATPVTGAEYLKRRQASAGRIAAIEHKLKTITGDSVREWRSRQERRKHHWFALVPRANRDRFIASLRGAGGSESVRLRLTGPWPPSEFLSELTSA